MSPVPDRVHPIEVESYEILRSRIDLSSLPAPERAVVERIIHASADLEYAHTVVCSPGACDAGLAALRTGAPVVCDVEMVRNGITGAPTACYLGDPGVAALVAEAELTRSAAGIRLAAAAHPEGAVVCVGNAPTALEEAIDRALDGTWRPSLVVGLPVGFVGAAEAKARLRDSGLLAVSNVGEKGGSAVAAAVINALWRLA